MHDQTCTLKCFYSAYENTVLLSFLTYLGYLLPPCMQLIELEYGKL